MVLAFKIIIALFMVLYFLGAIGAKKESDRHFYFIAAIVLALILAASLLVL